MSQKTKKLVKVELLNLNEAYQKVLIWFFSYPQKEIGLNDLAFAVHISKTTAHRVVTELMEEGFLKKEEIGRVWRISCNQEHNYNFSRKIAYNLGTIYESGVLEKIHEVVPSSRAIVLFGSYRKGDDTSQSDIDIAVEVIGNKNVKIVELGTFPKLGYRENIAVNLHVFSRGKIDLNLFSNIANGIVLGGFLEVKS